ncbi:unnamed protein product [Prunus armeniaca]|uniref:Uncharacterized protein n=1 Tax=Prunus armeniaca TaxID=36596 RepID=A0A6J5VZG2_PRUAR|nr:unnamed protein product [Prunus armeniaca]
MNQYSDQPYYDGYWLRTNKNNQYSYQPCYGYLLKTDDGQNNPQPKNYGYEEDSDYDEDDHEPNYGLDQNNPQPNDYGNEEEPDYHQNTHEPTNYGYEEDNDGCEEDNDYDEDNHESNYGFDCQNSVNGYVEPLKGSNSFDNEVVQPSHGYAANTATNKPLANQEVDAHVVFTQASKLYNNPHLH